MEQENNLENTPKGRHGILSVTISDKNSLYSSYMPFIKNGGIFVPTKKSYSIGEEVFMVISFLDFKDKIAVNGKVIWVTPVAAQNNLPSGIGVQIAKEDESQLRNKIETNLAGMLQSDIPTNTM